MSQIFFSKIDLMLYLDGTIKGALCIGIFLVVTYRISEKIIVYFGLISLPSSITGALFRKFPHIQKLAKSLPDLQSPSDFF